MAHTFKSHPAGVTHFIHGGLSHLQLELFLLQLIFFCKLSSQVLIIKRRQKGGFVKGRFWRMCPRSGVCYPRSGSCTFVPVFGAVVPFFVPLFDSFRISFCKQKSFNCK